MSRRLARTIRRGLAVTQSDDVDDGPDEAEREHEAAGVHGLGGSVAEEAVEVHPFPAARAVEAFELRFFGEELRRVELAAPVNERDVVLLVQHLVKDDPLDEPARHEAPVQRRVKTDEAI